MTQQLLTLSGAAQTAMAGALATLLNGGSVNVYSGLRPSGPDQSLATVDPQPTLLATFTLANPAFATASNGIAAANAITAVTPVAEGHADWFRSFETDGTTPVADGNCSADQSGDLWLNAQEIDSNVSSLSITAWYLRPPVNVDNQP